MHRIVEKYSVGDLVELQEIACPESSTKSRVGQVATVIGVWRQSKHGTLKWAIRLKFSDDRKVTIFTKYKYCHNKLRVLFRL